MFYGHWGGGGGVWCYVQVLLGVEGKYRVRFAGVRGGKRGLVLACGVSW